MKQRLCSKLLGNTANTCCPCNTVDTTCSCLDVDVAYPRSHATLLVAHSTSSSTSPKQTHTSRKHMSIVTF